MQGLCTGNVSQTKTAPNRIIKGKHQEPTRYLKTVSENLLRQILTMVEI
ncbi:MAG: hypothetical protein Q8P70_02430 [bacterium]|nr:hypothetical protein [bacterium]